MIGLPEENWSDPEVLADWIELNAVQSGFVANGSALDHFKDARLWGDDERASEVTQTPHAQAVTDAWAALQSRNRTLVDSWPFELQPNIVISRENSVYAALLLVDIGRRYRAEMRPSLDGFRSLFEDVVAAGLEGLLGGRACRFGAPFPTDWPRGFPSRVSHLALEFGLESREADIPKLSSKQQKDDGLDVLGRLKLGDEDPGTLYVLAQCATGANWKDKRGEPSVTKWREYIAWDAATVRALAVPWAVRPRSELKRIHMDFDNAIVLDRWRIVAGRPHEHLDREQCKRLEKWVRAQFKALK